MRRILDACLQYGIFVMVDETYVEFAPEEKEVTSIPLTNYYTNLIILRGTSKFFAAPGLRLGYAVTGNQDLIKAINTRKNPWTINSLAEIAGRLMFPDEEYIQHTRELISGERDRLFHELSTWDSVTVYEASANFILMKIRKPGVTSQDLFDHCIRKGLMIRDCSTFPFLDDHFVRFCRSRMRGCWRRLERCCFKLFLKIPLISAEEYRVGTANNKECALAHSESASSFV